MNEGVVSKETVVLRRWGSSIQKFGFINGVDNVNWPPYRDSRISVRWPIYIINSVDKTKYLNHTLQEEAALEVNQFFPLVKLNCADEIKFFLCSLYAPPCVHSKDSPPPCRSLCSRVRKGCEPLMKEHGFAWPKSMACEQFPEANGSAICLSRPNKTVQSSLLSDSSTGDL